MPKTITVKRNGHIVEFIPIMKPCTYHSQDFDGICKNCNNTMKYVDGYYMIVTDRKGQKIGFTVDTIK